MRPCASVGVVTPKALQRGLAIIWAMTLISTVAAGHADPQIYTVLQSMYYGKPSDPRYVPAHKQGAIVNNGYKYRLVNTGDSCESEGYESVYDVDECNFAGKFMRCQMGVYDRACGGTSKYPCGCHAQKSSAMMGGYLGLRWAAGCQSQGKACSSKYPCICRSADRYVRGPQPSDCAALTVAAFARVPLVQGISLDPIRHLR